MAEKPDPAGTPAREFDDFLKSCPDVDEAAAATPLRVVGAVLRTKSADSFVLVGADGSRHDIPRAAVTGFTAIAGAANKTAELVLDRALLSEALVRGLGSIKIPIEKPLPADTLKELSGDGTVKEVPWDTLKEIGGGDTLKEGTFDTLKEIGGGDTIKELPFDTFKEVAGGEGTGIGDTLVEGIGQPGGELVNPAFNAMAMQRQVGQQFGGALTLKELPGDGTFKEGTIDTLKELAGDQTHKETVFDTLKELTGDTIKESPFDTLKEVAGGEGTGVADSLIEGGFPQPGGELVNPAMQAQARMAANQFAPQSMAAMGMQQNFKPVFHDSHKEIAFDQTLKELTNDHKHIKEMIKEVPKEVAWEGTGAADSLVEGMPDWGSIFTNPANMQNAGAIPFVLATPHQAPQGAVAQQMLAAQALAGRMGY